MKVFGFWERLTKIVFFRNGQVTVQPADQGAVDKSIEIPDISPATGQSVVLTDQAQTLKNKTISGADNTFQAIPGAALNADSVTADKLDPTTVGGAGLEIVNNGGTDNLAVKPDNISIEIESDAVQIKNLGVTTPKIADSAVTTLKIADQNVTTAKIADANVTTVKIADANVTTAKILDANVTTAKIADSAVTTEKIADNEVTNAKLETAVAVDGTGITLDKLRIEDGVGSNPDGRGKVLKRDSTTGAVVNGNQIPSTGEVLTDTVAQTALLKTLDRLQTQLVSISMTSSTVFHGNRVGVIEVLSSVTGAITEINVQNDDGAHLVIVNKTAAPILIDNEAVGASSGLQILTGTGGPINLASNGSLFLVYRTGTVNKWHVIGGTGGGAGGTVTQVTTPVAHGFTAADKGKALYLNGSVYAPAIATAANTAEIVGILAGVIDSDTFELATGGAVESISGDDFEGGSVPAKGTVIFLSASEAGKYTSTEPTVIGQVSKPIGIIFDSNKLFMYNMRGSVIGAANARTQISLQNNATVTVQSVSGYEAGELAGYVVITATTPVRFYVQAQFAKNGAGSDYNLSFQTTGDTPPAGFNVSITAGGNIQVTLPNITGFSAAQINFALNAPAIGTSFPLSIDSSSINIVESAPLSNRNRIINGDMRVDQRNNGEVLSYIQGESKYNLDRWTTGLFGTTYPSGTVLNAQQSTDAPVGFTNSLKITAAQDTTFDSNRLGSFITHHIEGYNVADFAFGTASAAIITLSFWVKSNKTGTMSISFENSDADRAYGAIVNIAQAATWERKTITFTGDTLGTWRSDNGRGLAITFGMGNNGSWLTSAAGTWSSTRAIFNPAQTNFLSTEDDYLALTGVQLEVGSKATAFERRPYGTELALCQRYFVKIGQNPGQGSGTFGPCLRLTVDYNQYMGTQQLPVSLRNSTSVGITIAGNTVHKPGVVYEYSGNSISLYVVNPHSVQATVTPATNNTNSYVLFLTENIFINNEL